MINSVFPRNKPSPIPKIITTPEYIAKGRLKSTYEKTKLAFKVPWMGVIAMAFSNYPNFYNALWKYMHPLSNSIEFELLCKRLVLFSGKKIRELNIKSILKNLENIGYSNYEIKQISEMNKVFTYGNMPYLIMATAARIFLEKGELNNVNNFTKKKKFSSSPKITKLLLIEEHHADTRLKEIYKSIKKNIGLPFINTDYRAFARWPSYFSLAWENLQPTLNSNQYERKVSEIHNYVIRKVLELPNPNQITSKSILLAAKKDKKINEIKKVVNLFQWLLPGLIANVAFMKEQLN